MLTLLLTSALAADLDVPASYPTLAAAVLAAADGDRILVGPTYSPGGLPVVITTDLVIEGVDAGQHVLIDRLVVDGGAVVEVRGVSLAPRAAAPGLFAQGSVDVTLDDVVLVPGVVDLPGVRMAEGARVELRAVSAERFGVGLGGLLLPRPVVSDCAAGDVCQLDIRDSRLADNARGAVLATNTDVVVIGSRLLGNGGFIDLGAALDVTGGSLVVEDSTLGGNQSVFLGGAISAVDADVTLRGGLLRDNAAWFLGVGGAVALVGGQLLIEPSAEGPTELLRNNAWAGGALWVQASDAADRASLDLTGALLTDNRAELVGGAVMIVDGVDATLSYAELSGNVAGSGGALAIGGSTGAAAVPQVTLEALDIVGSDLAATGSGGGLFVTGGAVVDSVDTTIDGTGAARGGGIAVVDATLTWTGGSVVNATALERGGGLFSDGAIVVLDGVVLRGNAAAEGGGGFSLGSKIDLIDSVLTGNADDGRGAAWVSKGDRRLWLEGVDVCAQQDGGTVLDVASERPDSDHALRFSTVARTASSVPTVRWFAPGEVQNVTFTELSGPAALEVGDGVAVTNVLFDIGTDVGVTGPAVGSHNLFHTTTPAEGGALPGSGAVLDDPLLLGSAPTDVCPDVRLDPASPAREAGDPSRLDDDGLPFDIGRAQEGVATVTGTTGPAEDRDQDGFSTPADCDDGDARVFPGAPDLPDDGLDSDCDGVDGATWLVGAAPCGCAPTGGPTGRGWLLLAGLVAWRTRRREALLCWLRGHECRDPELPDPRPPR